MPRTINVVGIGNLNFPDDMSNDDIEAAIKTHPQYPTEKFDTPDIGSTMGTMVNPAAVYEMIRGVPGFGKLLPNTVGNNEFRKHHPIGKNIPNAAGALATMGPASYGTLAATGQKFLPALLGQAGLYSSTNMADKAIEKRGNVTREDMKHEAIVGGLSALAGSALGKVLSPVMKARPANIPPPIPKQVPSTLDLKVPAVDAKTAADLQAKLSPVEFDQIMNTGLVTPKGTPMQGIKQTQDMLKKTLNEGRQASHAQHIKDIEIAHKAAIAQQNVEHAAQIAALRENAPEWPSRLMGAGVGHMAGGLPGALVGAAVTPSLKKVGAAWWANQFMQPDKQAILNAIVGASGDRLGDAVQN